MQKMLSAVVILLLAATSPVAAESWGDRAAAHAGAWTDWARSWTRSKDGPAAASGTSMRPAPSAADFSPSDAPASTEWSYAAKESLGCLLAGTAGTLAAVFGGGEPLANAVMGGAVAPAGAFAVYTTLVGVAFISFCAIGQALTPLVLHYIEEPQPVLLIPRPLPRTPPSRPSARTQPIAYLQ